MVTMYLFSEYDAVQDTSESQGKQLKVLSKDLEHSVQECIKIKEKLAETELDLAEKNSRLSTVTSELAERHARIIILEEERNCQDKTIEKLSLENKELVRTFFLGQPIKKSINIFCQGSLSLKHFVHSFYGFVLFLLLD
jgi:septal ring factor EnvC (AmiA/AmiB activator)